MTLCAQKASRIIGEEGNEGNNNLKNKNIKGVSISIALICFLDC